MDQHGWTIIDETAAELEMQELLFSLVKMLRPELVVETGCYIGLTTRSLGLACFQAHKGRVVSCDTNLEYVERAQKVCQDLPVQIRHVSSLDLPELSEADFIFSDSDYKFRGGEIQRAKSGAVIVVHDTRVSYDPMIPALDSLVRAEGGVTFDTYRGFGILRKR